MTDPKQPGPVESTHILPTSDGQSIDYLASAIPGGVAISEPFTDRKIKGSAIKPEDEASLIAGGIATTLQKNHGVLTPEMEQAVMALTKHSNIDGKEVIEALADMYKMRDKPNITQGDRDTVTSNITAFTNQLELGIAEGLQNDLPRQYQKDAAALYNGATVSPTQVSVASHGQGKGGISHN